MSAFTLPSYRSSDRHRLVALLLVVALLAASSTLTSSAASQQARPPAASIMLRLRYATFDPLKGQPQVDAALRVSYADPAARHYYIVQFNGPIQESWKQAAVAAGGRLYDYLPDYAFIVQLDGKAKAAVSQLPTVRWVGDYQPSYKLAPELAGFKSGSQQVQVRTFSGSQPDAVDSLLASNNQSSRDYGIGITMRGELAANQLTTLLQHEEVAWVEPYSEPRLLNDKARQITGANQVASDFGLYGAGQVVGVADTGLDTGNAATMHADFAGRIVNMYGLGRPNDASDTDGHGTHVAGTVMGNGVRSGSDPATHTYTNSFAGMAPEARLVFQSIGDANGRLGGIPADLNDLFLPAYNDGARVHNNSWGSDTPAYTEQSRDVDLFMWNHKDMIIVYAAGNAGKDANNDGVVDPGSIGSPATAKNDFSVGASENDRPPSGDCQAPQTGYANCTWGQLFAAEFPANPVKDDPSSNNINGMAAFSSRGPDLDGRIDPNISAPGTNIISAQSSRTSNTGWGAFNQYYQFQGGTSMAAPGVAGLAALVREFYITRRGVANPSAALVQATMLNGATDMAPGQYGSGPTQEMPARPNSVEGWGRANLSYALNPTGPITLDFREGSQVATGQQLTIPYTITGSAPLHVTLAWTDYPGSTSAAVQLVNNLDLSVTAPDGAVLWGNGVTNGDRRNTFETVDIASPLTGVYTVTVRGSNVAQGGSQPFAVVMHGGGSSGPVVIPCGSFIDVPTTNIFYSDIQFLACRGVISGFPGNTFQPNSNTTRGQFAKIATLGFGISPATPVTPSFSDVAANNVFYRYVEAAAAANVIRGASSAVCDELGVTAPCFAPNRNISRVQVAVIVQRARNYAVATPATPTFADVPAGTFGYAEVETLAARGIIGGGPCGSGLCFRPNDNIKRGELSKVVRRAIASQP